MGKLIAWEIGTIVFVAFVYIFALFCGYKPLSGVILTEIAIFAFLVCVITRSLSSEAFTTTAIALVATSVAVIFYISFVFVMVSCFLVAFLALFAALANSTEFKARYHYIFGSLVVEAGVIFSVLKYSHVLLGK